MRIEIIGNIASGKTTLAQLIAKAGCHVVFEKFKENPFWQDFYKDISKYGFETELTFHLQHYHDIKVNTGKANKLACDYSLILDRAYADITLTEKKRKIFSSVADEVELEIGPPGTIIYLQCPENVLLNRILERNRSVEKLITIDYLQMLSKSITARIDHVSESTSVIKIDSDQINFASIEEDKAKVLDIFKSI